MKNRPVDYIGSFFDQLSVYSDDVHGHDYKAFLRKSILKFFEYEDFSKFNLLPNAAGFANFCGEFLTDYQLLDLEGATSPIDLLAYSMCKSYSFDFISVKKKLEGFVNYGGSLIICLERT